MLIYHNPACGTSRNALALLRERGHEPQIVEYLKTPPDAATLKALIDKSGEPVRTFLRAKETLYTELGLDDPALDDASLIQAMVTHPVLINRPIVSTPLGTRLCRPADTVLDILPPA